MFDSVGQDLGISVGQDLGISVPIRRPVATSSHFLGEGPPVESPLFGTVKTVVYSEETGLVVSIITLSSWPFMFIQLTIDLFTYLLIIVRTLYFILYKFSTSQLVFVFCLFSFLVFS